MPRSLLSSNHRITQDVPNAELGQPSTKWGARLVTTKEFRGSPGGGGVNVVSALDGYLLLGESAMAAPSPCPSHRSPSSLSIEALVRSNH